MRHTLCTVLVFSLLLLCITIPPAKALHASQDPGLQWSSTNRISYSVRCSLGLFEGRSREQNYGGSALGLEYQDHKLSELKWDISEVVMAGIVFSCAMGRFGFNGGAWNALNHGDGEMQDYDWLLVDYEWTNYSRHDVDVTEAYIYDLNITYLLLQKPLYEMRAIFGFKKEFWHWTDKMYEFVYPLYYANDRGFRGNMGGLHTIDYEQSFEIPYFGLMASGIEDSLTDVTFDGKTDTIEWSAYALYSTRVTAKATDHHVERGLQSEYDFEDGRSLLLGGSGTYRFTPSVFATISLTYQRISRIRGDRKLMDENGTRFIIDGGGISQHVIMASFAIGYLF